MASKVNGGSFHSMAGPDLVNGNAERGSVFQRGIPGRSSMVHMIANTTFGGTFKRGQPGRATMVPPNSRPLYLNKEARNTEPAPSMDEPEKTSPHQKFKNIFARVKDGFKLDAVRNPVKLRRSTSVKSIGRSSSKSRSLSHENLSGKFHESDSKSDMFADLPVLPPPPSYEEMKFDVRYHNVEEELSRKVEDHVAKRIPKQGSDPTGYDQQNVCANPTARVIAQDHTDANIKIFEYESAEHHMMMNTPEYNGRTVGSVDVGNSNEYEVLAPPVEESSIGLDNAADKPLAEFDNLQRKLNYELLLLKSDQELMRMVTLPPSVNDYIQPPDQWQEFDNTASCNRSLSVVPPLSRNSSSVQSKLSDVPRPSALANRGESDQMICHDENHVKDDTRNEACGMKSQHHSSVNSWSCEKSKGPSHGLDKSSANSTGLDGTVSSGISNLIKKYENYEQKVGKGPSMNLARFKVTRKSMRTSAAKSTVANESEWERNQGEGLDSSSHGQDANGKNGHAICSPEDWRPRLRKWPNMEDIGISKFENGECASLPWYLNETSSNGDPTSYCEPINGGGLLDVDNSTNTEYADVGYKGSMSNLLPWQPGEYEGEDGQDYSRGCQYVSLGSEVGESSTDCESALSYRSMSRSTSAEVECSAASLNNGKKRNNGEASPRPSDAFLEFLQQHTVQDPDVTISYYDIDSVPDPDPLLPCDGMVDSGSLAVGEKEKNHCDELQTSIVKDKKLLHSSHRTFSDLEEPSFSVKEMRQKFSMPDVLEDVVQCDSAEMYDDIDAETSQHQLELIESLKRELHEARKALLSDNAIQSKTCLGFPELDWYGSSWRTPTKSHLIDGAITDNPHHGNNTSCHDHVVLPSHLKHFPTDNVSSKVKTDGGIIEDRAADKRYQEETRSHQDDIVPPPGWETDYSSRAVPGTNDRQEMEMLMDLNQAFDDVLIDDCMPPDVDVHTKSNDSYDHFTPPPVAEVPPLNLRSKENFDGGYYYGNQDDEMDDDLETICEENLSDVEASGRDIDLDSITGPESDDSFEPPWADSVGARGEVFYVEPAEQNAVPPVSILADSSKLSNGANGKELQNGRKKKGLKKTVSKLIKPQKIEQRESNNNSRNKHNNHSVSFNEVPTGVLKDVYLFVDPTRHNYGRRATLCEALFGIVPGRFGSKAGQVNGTNPDRRIMVQALLPGGEALKSGDVKIGDWLMCINDLEINTDNVDSILSAITGPREVKVTLQKLFVAPMPRAVIQRSPAINEPLVQLISGERLHEVPPSLKDVPHLAMYLTLDASSETANSKEDLLYEFPAGDSKLIAIRGLFITLSHILLDITDNTAKNSTLLVENRLVHVGYGKEGREVLILAMPANKVSLQQVNCVVSDVIRLIKLLYGSLHSAFSTKENHRRLDHLFSLIFQHHLLAEELLLRGSPQSQFVEPFYETMAGVRTLTLPEETKVLINNCLSEFEAADFADMSDDFYEMRRSYTILGSCLFYKGYLAGNHLPSDDLYDLSLYLRSHCLLTLCNQEQMGQLVIWTEVFPWRRCHKQTEPLIPGYTEPDARFFYLVVGMKNNMLATVLEAGGCASWAQGHPSPDPFFVDQAKATLLQLETLDVVNQCEFRLLAPPVPSLACSDWFLPKNTKEDSAATVPLVKVYNIAKSATPPSKKLLQPESILKKNNSPRERPHGRGAIYDVDSDGESHSTGNSEASTPVLDRRKASAGSDESGGSGSTGSSNFFKGTKRRRNMLSAFDLSGMKRDLNELPSADELGSFVKLPSGCDNTLLTYVQLDSSEGMYICPSQQEMAPLATPLHRVVLSHFHRAAITIRQRLHHTLSVKKESENSSLGRFGLSKSLGSVIEHGVLFQYEVETPTDSKKAPATLNYWVIGRLFPEPYPREFYVCFQDSAQQNIVELAFKLGFGMAV